MIKYITRELQNVFRQKRTLITAIVIVALCFLANLAVMAFTLIYGSDRDGVLGSNVLAFATWVFVIPYYACILFADQVFGTYPNPMIKDKITKNMSRTLIYVGKFFSALVLALAYMLLAFVFMLLSTRIFHSDIAAYDISLFIENMLIAVPLWIAGISFGMMFLFIFENKKHAFIVYFVVVMIIPRIVMFFAAEPFSVSFLVTVRKILIDQSFGHIPYPADPNRNVTFIIAEGIVYTIISCIIGIIAFNKKDFSAKANNKSGNKPE